MPLVTFWMMHKNIDRLQAEDDQRTLRLLCAAQSGEDTAATVERLQLIVGEPFVVDRAKIATTEQLDVDGLDELRSMGNTFG